jgi:TIR domain
METATGPEQSGHVFICYATPDTDQVEVLERILIAHGIQVWRAASNLGPGDDWQMKIRKAIKDGFAFIACFSSRSTARESSYQIAELLLAIDELRRHAADSGWLIPVRLDDCQIPELDVGGGRTLTSIQPADLFGPWCQENTDRLMAKIKEISVRDHHPRSPAEPAASQPPKTARQTAFGAFSRTYQESVGWAGVMLAPAWTSVVLHAGTDPSVAAVYLSRVRPQRAARMLAASPPAAAAAVLRQMDEKRAWAILKNIPADKAQAIAEAKQTG